MDPSTYRRFHVWIAKGQYCAAAVISAPTLDEAKTRGAVLWTSARKEDLKGHPEHECASRGCDG
jgi:hypothetical protein